MNPSVHQLQIQELKRLAANKKLICYEGEPGTVYYQATGLTPALWDIDSSETVVDIPEKMIEDADLHLPCRLNPANRRARKPSRSEKTLHDFLVERGYL
jgi:hypothetical protein